MTYQQSGLSADTQALMAFDAGKKSLGLAFVFWFFLGGVGGHRFYLGRTGSAVAQLLLAIVGWLTVAFIIGLFILIPLGIWILVDAFLLSGMVREHNDALMRRLNQRPGPAPISSVDELAKFAALRDSGALSEEEYEIEKRRLLGTGPIIKSGTIDETGAASV